MKSCKRALAVCVGVALFGALGFGWSISGEWTTSLSFLGDDFGLIETGLELTGAFNGWEISSTSTFHGAAAPQGFADLPAAAQFARTRMGGPGFVLQEFSAKGVVGFADLTASMTFRPVGYTLWRWGVAGADTAYGAGWPAFLDHQATSYFYGSIAGYERHTPPLPPPPIGAQRLQIGSDAVGVLGPITVPGPSYEKADVGVKMDFFGVELGLKVTHQADKIVTFAANDFDDIPAKYNLPGMTELWSFWEYEGEFVYGWDWQGKFVERGTYEFTLVAIDGATAAGMPTVFPFDAGAGTGVAAGYLATWRENFDPPAPGWVSFQTPYIVGVEEVFRVYRLFNYMTMTFDVGVDPFTAQIVFDDISTGIQFHSGKVGFTDLELCCGVTFDAELSFTKMGFDYLELTMADLFTIMDYWTFDISITYGVDYKSVSVDVDFDFDIDLCVEIVLESDGLFDLSLDGFSITCEISDCNSVTFRTLFVGDTTSTLVVGGYVGGQARRWVALPELPLLGSAGPLGLAYEPGTYVTAEFDGWKSLNATQATAWGFQSGGTWKFIDIETVESAEAAFASPNRPDYYFYYTEEATQISTVTTQAMVRDTYWWEFESIELSFCGPGCCGADYEIGVSLFFAEYIELDMETVKVGHWMQDTKGNWFCKITGDYVKAEQGQLFGLSRIAFDASIPVMENFALDMGLHHNIRNQEIALGLGWTFTF